MRIHARLSLTPPMFTSRHASNSCNPDKLPDKVMRQFLKMFILTRINRLVLVLLRLLSGVLLPRQPAAHRHRARLLHATSRHGEPSTMCGHSSLPASSSNNLATSTIVRLCARIPHSQAQELNMDLSSNDRSRPEPSSLRPPNSTWQHQISMRPNKLSLSLDHHLSMPSVPLTEPHTLLFTLHWLRLVPTVLVLTVLRPMGPLLCMVAHSPRRPRSARSVKSDRSRPVRRIRIRSTTTRLLELLMAGLLVVLRLRRLPCLLRKRPHGSARSGPRLR